MDEDLTKVDDGNPRYIMDNDGYVRDSVDDNYVLKEGEKDVTVEEYKQSQKQELIKLVKNQDDITKQKKQENLKDEYYNNVIYNEKLKKKQWMAEKTTQYINSTIELTKKLSDDNLLDFVKITFAKGDELKLARYLSVEYILRKYKVITDYRTDIMKVYDNEKKYYRNIGEELIKGFLTESLEIYNTKSNSQEILHLLRTKTYVHDEDVNKAHSKEQIPLRNGILNIDTMELIDHSPKYLFDYQIPIDYDVGCECPNFDAFLYQIINDKDIPLIYDIFGLILYAGNYLEKFFVFTGTGSNGKSRLINLMEYFIGEDNCSSIPLRNLSDDKFAIANTYKKLLNVGADIGGSIIHDTSSLKSVCSSDKVSGQFKFGQIFDFRPTATEVFSANDPPIFADSSEGMFRRCETILFPNKFGNEKDMEEDSNCLKADPNILKKIETDKEMSGLLNMAVKHLNNIRKGGQLSVVKSTRQLKTDYIKYSDNVRAFLEDCCEEAEYVPSDVDPKTKNKIEALGFITNSEIYDKYCKYCDEHKLVKKSKDGFSKRLRHIDSWNLELGLQDWKDEKKERSIRGIKFKEINVENHTEENAEHTRHASLILIKTNDNKGVKTIKKGRRVLGVFDVEGVSDESKGTNTQSTPNPPQKPPESPLRHTTNPKALILENIKKLKSRGQKLVDLVELEESVKNQINIDDFDDNIKKLKREGEIWEVKPGKVDML